MNTITETRTQQSEWTAASLGALIRHILDTHHEYLKVELPKLSHLAHAAAVGGASEQPELLPALQKVFADLRSELESHMWKEEMVLFPMILRLEDAQASHQPAPPSHCGSVGNPIRVMKMEHVNAQQALAELRRLTNDYTPPAVAPVNFKTLVAGLAGLEADLSHHIALEDGILFPRAAELEARLK